MATFTDRISRRTLVDLATGTVGTGTGPLGTYVRLGVGARIQAKYPGPNNVNSRPWSIAALIH